jgi:hypothetical protein
VAIERTIVGLMLPLVLIVPVSIIFLNIFSLPVTTLFAQCLLDWGECRMDDAHGDINDPLARWYCYCLDFRWEPDGTNSNTLERPSCYGNSV